MSARGLALAALVVACGAGRGSARAATPAIMAGGAEPAVVVREPSCDDPSVAFTAFVDSLRVELAGRPMPCCTRIGREDSPPAPGAIEVIVAPARCGQRDGRLIVEVVGAGGGPRRELSLADVAASARPRALSLVVAELVRALAAGPVEPAVATGASASSVPASPAPSSLPAGEAVPIAVAGARPAAPVARSPSSLPAAARTSPPSLASSFQVGGGAAALELRHYIRSATTFAGVRAALIMGGARSRWTAEAGASLLYARRHLELGDVTIQCPNVSLAAGPRFASGPVVLQLSGRGEVGFARVAGRSDRSGVEAQEGSNVVLGMGLGARAEMPAGRSLRAALGVEIGATLRGITAKVSGEPVASLQGLYGLATLGIRISR